MATNTTPADKAKTDKIAQQQRKKRVTYKQLAEENKHLKSAKKLADELMQEENRRLKDALEGEVKLVENIKADREDLRKHYDLLRERYLILDAKLGTYDSLAAFGVWCEKHRKLLWRYIQYLWKHHEKEFVKQNNNSKQ